MIVLCLNMINILILALVAQSLIMVGQYVGNQQESRRPFDNAMMGMIILVCCFIYGFLNLTSICLVGRHMCCKNDKRTREKLMDGINVHIAH